MYIYIYPNQSLFHKLTHQSAFHTTAKKTAMYGTFVNPSIDRLNHPSIHLYFIHPSFQISSISQPPSILPAFTHLFRFSLKQLNSLMPGVYVVGVLAQHDTVDDGGVDMWC